MSTINTSMGRYNLKARDAANGHISDSFAINGEGSSPLTIQKFDEHNLDNVVNKVIYPITGGNREIAHALRDQMLQAGFVQPH